MMDLKCQQIKLKIESFSYICKNKIIQVWIVMIQVFSRNPASFPANLVKINTPLADTLTYWST